MRSGSRQKTQRTLLSDLEDAFEESPTTRVLLAEDDADMRALMARELAKYGYEVIEAVDGNALLQALETYNLRGVEAAPFDVVVSDLRMRGPTGITALRRLRAFDRRMPFILVTAFPDAALRREAAALGAHAVLAKPFPLPALVDLVESASHAR